MRRPIRRRRRRKLSLFLRYHLFILPLQQTARLLPAPLAAPLGTAVGLLLYRAVPRYREVALRNLAAVFEWEATRIDAVARQVFCNIGKTLVEFLRMPGISDEELRRRCPLEGIQHLRSGLEAGRGVLLVTAHYGNWELLAKRLVAEGFLLSVVAREADYPRTDALVNGIRERCGYHVIPRRHAPRGVLEALRRNEVVALLVDQNTVKGGEFVPFFGRPAATVTGPAVFALRTGAAVVPGFAIRQSDDTHLGRLLAPVQRPATGDRVADIRVLTEQLTGVIEEQVRADPAQWFWIHDRWRHRPPEDRAHAGRRGAADEVGGEEFGVYSQHVVPTHPTTQ
jgi:Kdo2-lipid IVA lauroyltransferase/acyltransferase